MKRKQATPSASPPSFGTSDFEIQVAQTPEAKTPSAYPTAAAARARFRPSAPSTPLTPRSTPGTGTGTAASTPSRTPRAVLGQTPRLHTPMGPPQSPARRVPSTPARTAPGTPAASARSLYIVTIVEFRNRQTVGLAAMNLRRPELILSQYSDNPTYTNTMMLLNAFDPSEILMSDTAVNSALYRLIRGEFEMVQLEAIRRKYFNESKGLAFIQRHGMKSSLAGLSLDSSKYLCLAAAGCLTTYIEHIQQMTFASHSLKITFKTLQGHLLLDAKTVQNLELVSNLKSPRNRKQKGSLFTAINHCKTPGGARLLRTSILQPLNDLPTIKLRLDTVQELLSREDVFFDLVAILPKFVDVDHLASTLAFVPKHPTQRTAQLAIINLLTLKKTTELLPDLKAVCDRCQSDLLKTIASNLSAPSADEIKAAIDTVLEADATINKKSPEHMRTQMVFAVKAGINGLLDVARATYCQTIEEIHQTVDDLRTRLNAPNIRLTFTPSRGYHLAVPTHVVEEFSTSTSASGSASATPGAYRVRFVQQVRRGKWVMCSTEELVSLESRQQEAFAEINLMTERVIQDLSTSVRQHMGWIINLAECLAFLDMMVSFANMISLGDGFVRPEFTKDGPLAIKQGRHPVIEALRLEEFVPNDCYLTPVKNVQLVAGPNNSGKSTFLRQIGVLTVLAHIGCYVPAAFASFRLTDKLLTRMSMDDDMEGNSGSFFAEMKETAHVLASATNNSLILLDELGRGTSVVDGLGVAWAVCEELMQKSSYVLFATHYHELADLAIMYPCCKMVSLKVEPEGGKMRFRFQVTDGGGGASVEKYGIYIAELAGFPAPVVEEARKISAELRLKAEAKEDGRGVFKNKSFYTLLEMLMALKHTTLSSAAIRRLESALTLSADIPYTHLTDGRVLRELYRRFFGSRRVLGDLALLQAVEGSASTSTARLAAAPPSSSTSPIIPRENRLPARSPPLIASSSTTPVLSSPSPSPPPSRPLRAISSGTGSGPGSSPPPSLLPPPAPAEGKRDTRRIVVATASSPSPSAPPSPSTAGLAAAALTPSAALRLAPPPSPSSAYPQQAQAAPAITAAAATASARQAPVDISRALDEGLAGR